MPLILKGYTLRDIAKEQATGKLLKFHGFTFLELPGPKWYSANIK